MWILNFEQIEVRYYKQHARAGRVCQLGGVNHAQWHAERTSHSALVTVAKEMLLQSWASA